MIELNEKTQQDFLNRKWVQKLLDAGVDMSDAYYGIGRDKMHGNRDKIFFLHMWGLEDTESFIDKIPTYTVSEMLYKLYKHNYNVSSFSLCGSYYSIVEHLAYLLLQYHKKDIGTKTKDTGDISDK